MGLAPKPISEQSFGEKLKTVFEGAVPKLPGALQNEAGNALKEMVSPANLATTVGVFAVWSVASTATGPLGLAANAVLVGITYFSLGSVAIDLILGLADLITGINDASCQADLDRLSQQLADLLANVAGVAGSRVKVGDLLRSVRGKTVSAARNTSVDPNAPKLNKPSESILGRIWRREGFSKYNSNQKGVVGELETTAIMKERGYERVGNTVDDAHINTKEDFDALVKARQGKQGIDGIYKRVGPDGKVEYVITESKTTGGVTPDDRCGMSLCTTQNDGMQMSEKWIENRLEHSGLDSGELAEIRAALDSGRVKRVVAQTDRDGTRFFEVTPKPNDITKVTVGSEIKL